MSCSLRWTSGLVMALVFALVLPLCAQQADDFGPAPEKPGAKEKPGAAKKPAPERKPGAEAELPQREDPAVEAVLTTNPTTPAECTRAAKILADLKRPELSKKLLRQVLDAKLEPKQLAELGGRFGSALFIELARRKELLPEAEELCDAVLAAADQQLRDPQRLARLIKQLQDPSPQIRWRAVAGLKEARGAAVGPLIDALADPSRAAEHAAVRAALVYLGDDAVGPLLGTLEKSEPALMAQAIQVLAEMNARNAAVYLLGPYTADRSDPQVRKAAEAALGRWLGRLPSKAQAVATLVEQARWYFDRGQPVPGEVAGEVEIWSWDVAKKQCVPRTFPADDARRAVAARLARDAFALTPNDPQVRLLYLATMLEEAAYENGLDKPLEDREGSVLRHVAAFGSGAVEGVLEYAMANRHPAAAAAAATVLGRSGQTEILLFRDAGPAPLVRAAQSPDRRLRMAAIEAIVRLQPQRPFAGASYVTDALTFFAASSGTRRVLVGGPNTEMCRDLAGLFAEIGLEVDTATSGRELLRLALASPEYELALIDVCIDQPTADLLVQQLRRDCRTADLRVGLIARDGYFEQAQRIARRYPLTLSFVRPRDSQAFQWQMQRLAELAPREFVGHQQRQQQAAAALTLLAGLSGSAEHPYDLRRTQEAALTALYNPALSPQAVDVLARFGTPESQRALVELASRFTQPLELRRAAVAAFRQNIEKHGILLTTGEIRRQYERYNQSAELDSATQQVLAMVLDCIEAPTQPLKPKPGKQ